ncbi:MAG: hypothetical protein MHMPM18_003057 [Marteilia pararefringens]
MKMSTKPETDNFLMNRRKDDEFSGNPEFHPASSYEHSLGPEGAKVRDVTYFSSRFKPSASSADPADRMRFSNSIYDYPYPTTVYQEGVNVLRNRQTLIQNDRIKDEIGKNSDARDICRDRMHKIREGSQCSYATDSSSVSEGTKRDIDGNLAIDYNAQAPYYPLLYQQSEPKLVYGLNSMYAFNGQESHRIENIDPSRLISSNHRIIANDTIIGKLKGSADFQGESVLFDPETMRNHQAEEALQYSSRVHSQDRTHHTLGYTLDFYNKNADYLYNKMYSPSSSNNMNGGFKQDKQSTMSYKTRHLPSQSISTERRTRTLYSDKQYSLLNHCFKKTRGYLNTEDVRKLERITGLKVKQIRKYFANRRSRSDSSKI